MATHVDSHGKLAIREYLKKKPKKKHQATSQSGIEVVRQSFRFLNNLR